MRAGWVRGSTRTRPGRSALAPARPDAAIGLFGALDVVAAFDVFAASVGSDSAVSSVPACLVVSAAAASFAAGVSAAAVSFAAGASAAAGSSAAGSSAAASLAGSAAGVSATAAGAAAGAAAAGAAAADVVTVGIVAWICGCATGTQPTASESMKAEMKGRMRERGCKQGTTRRRGSKRTAFRSREDDVEDDVEDVVRVGCGVGDLGEDELDAGAAFAPIRRAGRACDAPCGALQLRVMTHAACCPGACRLVVLA
jgi:hypothetical protein